MRGRFARRIGPARLRPGRSLARAGRLRRRDWTRGRADDGRPSAPWRGTARWASPRAPSPSTRRRANHRTTTVPSPCPLGGKEEEADEEVLQPPRERRLLGTLVGLRTQNDASKTPARFLGTGRVSDSLHPRAKGALRFRGLSTWSPRDRERRHGPASHCRRHNSGQRFRDRTLRSEPTDIRRVDQPGTRGFRRRCGRPGIPP